MTKWGFPHDFLQGCLFLTIYRSTETKWIICKEKWPRIAILVLKRAKITRKKKLFDFWYNYFSGGILPFLLSQISKFWVPCAFIIFLYIFSKYRPSGPMLSISLFVQRADAFYKPICPSVCPCVHFWGTV